MSERTCQICRKPLSQFEEHNIAHCAEWLSLKNADQTKLLQAAVHALRSYQYGNGSPDLAKEIADRIEKETVGS